MFKRYYFVAVLTLYNFCSFAQSVYMHEAQEDSINGDGFSFRGFIFLLIIIGIIWLVKQIFKGNKKH